MRYDDDTIDADGMACLAVLSDCPDGVVMKSGGNQKSSFGHH